MKTIILLCSAAMAVPAAASAAAEPRVAVGPVGAYQSFQPPAAPNGTVRSVIGVVVNSGTPDVDVPAGTGLKLDDPFKINCTSPNGCTILMSAMAFVVKTHAGDFSLCPAIDGDHPEVGCGWQGHPEDASRPVTGFTQTSYSVAQGKHSVHFQINMQAGGHLVNYHTAYQILTP